jgi:hypothetical protein
MNSIYQNALVISGPGINDAEQILSYISSRIPHIITIGDGKQTILDPEFSGIYADFLRDTGARNEFSSTDRTLVVINAHGDINDNQQHRVQFGIDDEGAITYFSSDLFQDLSNAIKNPFDILFLPCHAGGAKKDIGLLPYGTNVMFTSGDDEPSISTETHAAFNHFPTTELFSINSFYNHYLFNMACFAKASLLTAGTVIELSTPYEYHKNALVAKYISPPNHQKAIDKIHEFCKNDDACYSKLSVTLNKISLLKDIKDVFAANKVYAEKLIEIYESTDEAEDIMTQIEKGNKLLKENSIPGEFYYNESARDDDEDDDEDDDGDPFIAQSGDNCIVRMVRETEMMSFKFNDDYPLEQNLGASMLVASFLQEVQQEYQTTLCA